MVCDRAWLHRRWGLCWILGLLLASCKTAPIATAVLVVIDSDLAVGRDLHHIEVQAFDREGQRALMDPYALNVEEGGRGLPLSFALLAEHQDESASFRVVVTGYGRSSGDGGERRAMIEQQVIGHFEPGRVLRLDIFLSRACYGADKLCRTGEEPGELTCDPAADGACGDVPVRTDLPTVTSDELGGYGSVALDRGPGDASHLDAEAKADTSIRDAAAHDVDASSEDDSSVPDTARDSAQESDAEMEAAVDDGVDDCVEYACKNGSTCVDGMESYSCDCGDSGYTGERCDDDINECAGENVCTGVAESGASFAYACHNTRPYYVCGGLFPDWKIVEPPVRFSTNENVVLDHMTGREWLNLTPSDVLFTGITPFQLGSTWQQAKELCETRPERGGGWRLPTRTEVLSIFDHANGQAYPPVFSFSLQRSANIPALWTSSAYVAAIPAHPWLKSNEPAVWVVGLDGYPAAASVSSDAYFSGIVQCVK